MKILVLVLQYPPDVNTTGQLMGQLVDTWASHGHEVSVITSFPHYEHFRIWPEYRGRVMEKSEWERGRMGEGELGGQGDKETRGQGEKSERENGRGAAGERESVSREAVEREGESGGQGDKGTGGQGEWEKDTRESGREREALGARSDALMPSALRSSALTPYGSISVTRVWVHANGNKSMLNRLASYLSFNALAAVAGVMTRDRWDVIFCPNGSFFNGLTGWFLGRARVPVVYNVQDLYPDVPINAGQLRSKFAIGTLRWIERFMYRRAAHVTGISASIIDAVRMKGIERWKTSTIPNFVDTGFIKPLPKMNCVARRLDLQNKFVVMNAGYLGFAYDLETMLYAAALLPEPEILFVIVGNGVAKASLEKKAQELGLENVRFLPFLPREDLPWLRAAADVQVSLHKEHAAQHSMPSKVYEIMASGRPLLASSDKGSDVWNLVEETGCGVSLEPGQPEKLAETILELYRNPALREKMGELGREHAVAHCSKEAVAGEYLRLFQRLTADRRRQTAEED